MCCAALQEPMQRVGSSMCEVGTKAIPSHVFHFMLVWKRRYCTLWVEFGEFFVQEDEVRETPTDFHKGLLEGRKIGLRRIFSKSWYLQKV